MSPPRWSSRGRLVSFIVAWNAFAVPWVVLVDRGYVLAPAFLVGMGFVAIAFRGTGAELFVRLRRAAQVPGLGERGLRRLFIAIGSLLVAIGCFGLGSFLLSV